eukprot:403347554
MELSTLKGTMNTIKGIGGFSTAFWRFIKEEIGVQHIYPDQKSYVKKKPTFEERQAKIEQMLEKVEFNDEKLSNHEQQLQRLSDEALELHTYIKKLGLMPDICVEDYLVNFFQSLYFQRQGIQQMDELLLSLNNLLVLNLSYNQISRVQNLPKNLRELYLTGNQIDYIDSRLRVPSLVHLGLGFNNLTSEYLAQIVVSFPGLFSLDLAFNQLDSLAGVIDNLMQLPDLRMLSLIGNPLTLTTKYRDILKQRLKMLKVLDNIPTLNESDSPKKKAKKLSQDPQYGQMIEIKDEFSLDLQFRVLSNIDGIYLNEENCASKMEMLDQLQDQEKSSVFWLSYTNHFGNQVQSESKIWIQHFAVDKEAGIGKTDINFKLRMVERPTLEFREWIRRDLLVELWETRPRIAEKKNEDESVTKEVVINSETNKPIIDKKLRGILKVQLNHLIQKPELAQEELIYHQKAHFFDPKFKAEPEFMFDNFFVNLKDQEKQILVENLSQQEEEAKQRKLQEEANKVQSQANILGGKPGGKPDPKKDPKLAAQKKGAVVEDKNAPKTIVVDYPDIPTAPNYQIFEKTYAQMRMQILHEQSGITAQSQKKVAKVETADEKKASRAKELLSQYQIVRALPFSLIVKTRFNLPEEVIEVKKDPEPVIDPKKRR